MYKQMVHVADGIAIEWTRHRSFLSSKARPLLQIGQTEHTVERQRSAQIQL
jgi:hypothetical protein